MVGPLKSDGCKRCRERKVRCDLGRPACGACVRRKEQCGGWHDLKAVRWTRPTTLIHLESTAPAACGHPAAGALLTTFAARPMNAAFKRARRAAAARGTKQNADRESSDEAVVIGSDTTNDRSHGGGALFDPMLTFLDFASVPLAPPGIIASAHMEGAWSAFYDIYVPRQEAAVVRRRPHMNVIDTHAWRVSKAYTMLETTRSPLLSRMLRATALVFMGRRYGREDLIQYGIVHYRGTFGMLRDLVANLTSTSSVNDFFLVTFLIACSHIIELMGARDTKAAEVHSRGLCSIAYALGLQRSHEFEFQDIICSMRLVAVWDCLVDRRHGFICDERWMYRSWCRTVDQQPNPMHLLLDEAALLPAILQEFDRLRLCSAAKDAADDELQLCWDRAWRAWDALEQWKHGNPRQASWAKSNWGVGQDFGMFLDYADFDAASTWLLFCQVRLVFWQLAVDMTAHAAARGASLRGPLAAEEQLYSNLVGVLDEMFATVEYMFDYRHGILSLGWANIAASQAAAALVRAAEQSAVAFAALASRKDWLASVRAKFAARGFGVVAVRNP